MLQNIPAKYRKAIYTALFIVGVALGATQAAFTAAGESQPVALTVAWVVLGYVSTALGFPLARANVPSQTPRNDA